MDFSKMKYLELLTCIISLCCFQALGTVTVFAVLLNLMDFLKKIPLITWSLNSIWHDCWHGCTCLPSWNIPLPWLLWLTALSYSLLLWLLFLGILPKPTSFDQIFKCWSQILSLLFFSLYCTPLDESVTLIIMNSLKFTVFPQLSPNASVRLCSKSCRLCGYRHGFGGLKVQDQGAHRSDVWRSTSWLIGGCLSTVSSYSGRECSCIFLKDQ